RPDPRHGGPLLGRDPPRARAHPRVPEAAAGRPPHAEARRPRVDPTVVGGRGEGGRLRLRPGHDPTPEAPTAPVASLRHPSGGAPYIGVRTPRLRWKPPPPPPSQTPSPT